MPPTAGGAKKELQVCAVGQTPPHVGEPGVPHGVLPAGRHAHVPSGGSSPKLAHSSPAGHVPLQVGPLSPHGTGRPRRLASEQSASGGAAALVASKRFASLRVAVAPSK